jgi:hypothetical protein
VHGGVGLEVREQRPPAGMVGRRPVDDDERRTGSAGPVGDLGSVEGASKRGPGPVAVAPGPSSRRAHPSPVAASPRWSETSRRAILTARSVRLDRRGTVS